MYILYKEAGNHGWKWKSLYGLKEIPRPVFISTHPNQKNRFGSFTQSFNTLTWILVILSSISLMFGIHLTSVVYHSSYLKLNIQNVKNMEFNSILLYTIGAITEPIEIRKWFINYSAGNLTTTKMM